MCNDGRNCSEFWPEQYCQLPWDFFYMNMPVVQRFSVFWLTPKIRHQALHSKTLAAGENLEGTPSEEASWSENEENVRIFSFACFIQWFKISDRSIFFFFPLNLSSSGCSHVGLLFINEWIVKRRKWLGHDVICTPATYADLFHNIIVSKCQTQWQQSQLYFNYFQMSV